MAAETEVITQRHDPTIKQRVIDIDIPDLWHIAETLRAILGSADEDGIADDILKVWYLAHSLKKHIIENG